MNFSSFCVHEIEGYISKVFLVVYDQAMLLLDSGSICDVEKIEAHCRSLGRSPMDIKLTVVSHMHPDHCGGACLLRRKYQIPIAAFKDVDRWYAGLGGYIQYHMDCYMAGSLARKRHLKYELLRSQRFIQPDYLLQDAVPLPFFDDWQALHVPGHTMHDIALYNAAADLLYVGDFIIEVQGQATAPLPVLFPQTMLASLDRLAALPAPTLLLAHGHTIGPEQASAAFEALKACLNRPSRRLERRIYILSLFSHEARKNLDSSIHR
jgi:glyoxylase-like metal-dependent hydrolase (beta-lactamase superfamily II)